MISVNAVNKWIFSRPEVYQLFDSSPTPFTSAVEAPVYPINQIPEGDSPYTVFTWKTRKSPSHFTMHIDEIVYWIWDHNIARLQDYESVLRKYLGQEDESAQAFNRWANGEGTGILMHWARYLGSSDTYPEKQEGGIVGKSLTFSVQYVDCTAYTPLNPV